MTRHDEIRREVTSTIAEVLVLPISEVRPSDKLAEDLDADSLAFIELAWSIRDKLGIDLPEPRVTEAMLSLPLVQGIRQLGDGGDNQQTLFEYVGASFGLEPAIDTELESRLANFVTAVLARAANREWLMKSATGASNQQGPAIAIALQLHQPGVVSDRLRATLTETPDLLDAIQALAFDATQIASTDWMIDVPEVSVAEFSAVLGTSPPRGLQEDTLLTGLTLRDIVRFITVDSYCRYVAALDARSSP